MLHVGITHKTHPPLRCDNDRLLFGLSWIFFRPQNMRKGLGLTKTAGEGRSLPRLARQGAMEGRSLSPEHGACASAVIPTARAEVSCLGALKCCNNDSVYILYREEILRGT